MTVSSSPEFRRIISGRSWFHRSLLPGLAAGLAGSVLLAVALVSGGALAWLLTEGRNSGVDRGLLPLLESGTGTRCQWLTDPLQKMTRLHSSGTAAAVLLLVGGTALVLRGVLKTLAEDLVDRHVAAMVLRLRQHLHRAAIRLEQGDLSGNHSEDTRRLFLDSTRTLESAARDWGTISMSVWPDLTIILLVALAADWRAALQALIPVVLGRMLLQRELQRGESSLRLLSEQVSRGIRRIAESLRKPRIIASFGMEQAEQQNLTQHLNDYQSRCRSLRQQQRMSQGIHQSILLLMALIPLALLVTHVLRGMHPGTALLLTGCVILLDLQLARIPRLQECVSLGSVAADEIAEYLNRIPAVSQAPGARFFEPMSKTLTFNQVSWQSSQFPNLLNGLDLRISFGERVALLSLQPAAAYALASMLPRFIDPDLGQVLIDGRDIREATLESLRAEAILAGGSDPVFSTTVLENITCGHKDITRQQAIDAAKLVHADHFIRTLPKGYETPLGEHGVQLDPGQMFRISLARAIVREPALLIVEEPAIPLDSETKTMLDDTYQRIGGNRTLIFLPTRLSTVKRCSRIVLIHEGRVAVDGVHEHLVRSNDLYRHWEYQRFNPYRDEPEPV